MSKPVITKYPASEASAKGALLITSTPKAVEEKAPASKKETPAPAPVVEEVVEAPVSTVEEVSPEVETSADVETPE